MPVAVVFARQAVNAHQLPPSALVSMLLISQFVGPFLIGFAVTLAAGIGICATRRWHGSFSIDDTNGPQKLHVRQTPRIGGIAVYAGYWAIAGLAPAALSDLLLVVGLSALPVFLAGLVEDVTKGNQIVLRLVASVVSGFLFCLLSGHGVPRLDVPIVDHLVAIPAIAVVLTAVMVTAFTHALNVVDGLHGLATGIGIVMLAAFAIIAERALDHDLALFCLIMIGVLAGFLVINFPFGHLFLGDCGAYLVGFIVAVTAVALSVRNPDVSPWACVVVLSYPLLETIFSHRSQAAQGSQTGPA